jgi:hypothetical protein
MLECVQVLLAVLCDEFLCILLKDFAVVLVLVGNSTFDGIIGLGRSQDLTDEHQNVANLVWGFPLVGAQHTQTHGAFVIVADVWVVDLGLEGDGGRLEGVFLGERD